MDSTAPTRATAEAAASVNAATFDYLGVQWHVATGDEVSGWWFEKWNAGQRTEAMVELIGEDQAAKFREVCRTQGQINGWFEAYNKVAGGNS